MRTGRYDETMMIRILRRRAIQVETFAKKWSSSSMEMFNKEVAKH
jgi:hypothetical protein